MKFKVGDLVTLSSSERKILKEDAGLTAFDDWNYGLVIEAHPKQKTSLFQYLVRWFPSGELHEETNNSIILLTKEK
jgi:hypothetical protein